MAEETEQKSPVMIQDGAKADDSLSEDKNDKLTIATAVSVALNSKQASPERPASVSSHLEDEEDPEEEAAEPDSTTPGKASEEAEGAKDTTPLRPKQWLPKDFEPHQNDVLCGRGKTYREWPG